MWALIFLHIFSYVTQTRDWVDGFEITFKNKKKNKKRKNLTQSTSAILVRVVEPLGTFRFGGKTTAISSATLRYISISAPFQRLSVCENGGSCGLI